jgi:hypothetical protein
VRFPGLLILSTTRCSYLPLSASLSLSLCLPHTHLDLSSGKSSMQANNSVSDHYTALLPSTEEHPAQLSRPPSLPSSNSSLRLSRSSQSSTLTAQQQRQQNPMANSFTRSSLSASPTPAPPPASATASDDFLNFIQQPTTRVHSSSREKSLSDETGEAGLRLSSPASATQR